MFYKCQGGHGGIFLLLSGNLTFRAALGQASKPINQLTKLAAVKQILIFLWKGRGREGGRKKDMANLANVYQDCQKAVFISNETHVPRL